MRTAIRAAALAAVCVLVAAGCGDVRAQTQWSDDRTEGVSADAGEIAIRNALVVADGDRATVLASFANRGVADDLVSVRVGGSEAEPDGGPLTIPAQGFASVGPGHTRVDIDGVQLEPGRQVEVEFIFGAAPRATVLPLVQPADGRYADALDP